MWGMRLLYIAQHRRRTRYAPENTWSAISDNKRGYKSQAHLQLGFGITMSLCIYQLLITQPNVSNMRTI
jgi:uncharacterized protein YktB (UPF0637 family)